MVEMVDRVEPRQMAAQVVPQPQAKAMQAHHLQQLLDLLEAAAEQARQVYK
jgi:hypothetical protein